MHKFLNKIQALGMTPDNRNAYYASRNANRNIAIRREKLSNKLHKERSDALKQHAEEQRELRKQLNIEEKERRRMDNPNYKLAQHVIVREALLSPESIKAAKMLKMLREEAQQPSKEKVEGFLPMKSPTVREELEARKRADNFKSYELLKTLYENYYESRMKKVNHSTKTLKDMLEYYDLNRFDNTIDYSRSLSVAYRFAGVQDVFILDGDKIIGIKEPPSTNGGSRRRGKSRRKTRRRKQTKRKKQTRKYMF